MCAFFGVLNSIGSTIESSVIYISQIRLNFDPRTTKQNDTKQKRSVNNRGNYGTQWIHVHRYCCDRVSRFIRIWYVLCVCVCICLWLRRKIDRKKEKTKKNNKTNRLKSKIFECADTIVYSSFECVCHQNGNSCNEERKTHSEINLKIIRQLEDQVIEMSEPVKMTTQNNKKNRANCLIDIGHFIGPVAVIADSATLFIIAKTHDNFFSFCFVSLLVSVCFLVKCTKTK